MKANYKPVDVADPVLSRVQSNIVQAFTRLDQPAALSVKTVTANYLVTVDDDVVLCDPTRGAFTISLPALGVLAKAVALRKVGSGANPVTISAPNPVTIDGAASLALDTVPMRLVNNAQGYWSS